jgi:hypothetical protein
VDLTLSQSASLRFSLVASTDGSEMTGLAYSDLTCKYATSAMTALDDYALAEYNVTEIGHGVYEIFFTDTILDVLGPVTFYLTATGATPCWREDVIVEGTTWQGRTVRILVQDGDDAAIEDANVQVRNDAGTMIVAQGTTNTDGYVDIMLVDGDYKVYVWAVGWTFSTSPVSLTVTGGMSLPVVGEAFSPANPGGPSLTTVYGWLLDAAGSPRVGVAVAFTPIYESEASVSAADLLRPLASSSVSKLLARTAIADTTDAEGYFEATLTPNSDILPAGSRYKVAFSDVPSEVALITVPAVGPVNIEDLLT